MLLTVAEFRGYVETALEDDPIQGILNAAETEVDMAAGPVGSTVELIGGGQRVIALSRPIGTITTITETVGTTVTTLAADDYLVHPNGYIIERLTGGTNSRWTWRGRVTVTQVPDDDLALRKDVQRELVTLAINYQPNVSQETVGSWTRQFRQAIAAQSDERDAILGRLDLGPSMLVVGG